MMRSSSGGLSAFEPLTNRISRSVRVDLHIRPPTLTLSSHQIRSKSPSFTGLPLFRAYALLRQAILLARPKESLLRA